MQFAPFGLTNHNVEQPHFSGRRDKPAQFVVQTGAPVSGTAEVSTAYLPWRSIKTIIIQALPTGSSALAETGESGL